MALRQMTEVKWEKAKPAVLALMVGLVAGPYISNFLGWQVTSGTALGRERAGIVERLALICDAQARTEVWDPGKLDHTARTDLAKRWAVMPGRTAADPDVTAACSEKLERAGIDVLSAVPDHKHSSKEHDNEA